MEQRPWTYVDEIALEKPCLADGAFCKVVCTDESIVCLTALKDELRKKYPNMDFKVQDEGGYGYAIIGMSHTLIDDIDSALIAADCDMFKAGFHTAM